MNPDGILLAEGNSELNALPLEYQRDYGTAFRDLDVFDLMNNPAANGVCRIFGLGLPEEPFELVFRNLRSLNDDRAYTLLITQNPV